MLLLHFKTVSSDSPTPSIYCHVTPPHPQHPNTLCLFKAYSLFFLSGFLANKTDPFILVVIML